MEIKVYHTGNSFEDLIAKYLIVLDNNNIIFKGRVVKLLFKCGPVLPSHVLSVKWEDKEPTRVVLRLI